MEVFLSQKIVTVIKKFCQHSQSEKLKKKIFFNSYYVISFELEIFYQQLYKTQWWGAINEIVNNLRLKRLPLTDAQLHEQFKKKFGFKKAMKCKVFQ